MALVKKRICLARVRLLHQRIGGLSKGARGLKQQCAYLCRTAARTDTSSVLRC